MQNDLQQSNISKSMFDRLIEFYNALRIIFDSRKFISKGKYYHITTIYGQLRALLTDSTKKTELTPLFEIASILKEQIKIFYLPDTFEEALPELAENLIYHIPFLGASIEQTYPNQIEIDLKEYLDIPILTINKHKISTRKLIDTVSDKLGGSHYDSKIPKYLAELNEIVFNNKPSYMDIIIRISDLFTQIGMNLLKKITDFDLFVGIQPTSFQGKMSFFFEYVLENSYAMMALYSNQGKLVFLLRDLLNNGVQIDVERIIDTNKLYMLNISHRITSEFKSEIRINLDGVNIETQTFQDPLLVFNYFTNYHGYINTSHKRDLQDFEFGLTEYILYSKILEDIDKAQVYTYFSKKVSSKIVWFNKQSYGYSKPGSNDIIMNGHVVHKDIK